MSRKIKLLFLSLVVFGLFMFTAVTAFATTATSSAITFSVFQENGTTTVTGLTADLLDLAGNSVVTPGGITLDSSVAGKYTFSNITKGNYYVKLTTTGGISMSLPVSVTSYPQSGATPTAKTLTWMDKNSTTSASKRTGILGGMVVDSNGNALSNVTVEAYNSKGTWTSVSDSHGLYKLYLPADTYTFVVVGKDTTGPTKDYKNVSVTVIVKAGTLSGPLDELNAQTDWSSGEDTLGYSLNSTGGIGSDLKTIKGTANVGCTVSAYSVDSNSVYTFLSSVKVAKNGSNTTNNFTLTLPDYQPGKTIAVKVSDVALNVYQDPTLHVLANRTMNLTTSAAISTNGTIISADKIKLEDSSNSVMNGYLAKNVTKVVIKASKASSSTTLVKDTDYTCTSGSLTIKAGVLNTLDTYDITVSAAGYNDKTIQQNIVASLTPAPNLTASNFVIANGSAPGTTRFTTIGSPASTNSLVYQIAKATDKAQYKGNAITGTYDSLTANKDIGVDPTNKYIDIYEIDSSKIISKYLRVTAKILNPTIQSASVTGSAITIVTNTPLKVTTPAATSFVVTVGGKTDNVTVNGVSVSGSNVTLTLTDAVLANQIVKIKYTKPSATTCLQDANGNAVDSVTTAITVTNNSVAAAAADLTATIKKGTVTTSSAITFTAVNGHKFAVQVSSTTISTPNGGDALPSSGVTNPYTSGANITTVDATTNKYVAIYEIDADNKIIKFHLFTLDASVIK